MSARRWRSFLTILALSRSLPRRRGLRVMRSLGEQLALGRPFNRDLSLALDQVLRLQDEQETRA